MKYILWCEEWESDELSEQPNLWELENLLEDDLKENLERDRKPYDCSRGRIDYYIDEVEEDGTRTTIESTESIKSIELDFEEYSIEPKSYGKIIS